MRIRIILFIIFVLAILVRFLNFKESTYFGYDEARDAYISQEIYQNLDLKVIGPPGNFPGIYHSPFFWYLIGPFYLISKGDPFFVSAVFRVLNALGVVFVFLLATKLINKKAALFAAIIYAFSFEETQYAMYVGHPSLGIFGMIGIFAGAAAILRNKMAFGLFIMFGGLILSLHSEFILSYTIILVLILLFLLRDSLKTIKIDIWAKTFLLTAVLLSNFIFAEIKYNFQGVKALTNLVTSGYNVIPHGDNRFSLYAKMLLEIFQYNLLNLPKNYLLLVFLAFVVSLIYFSRKNISARIILIWIFAGAALLPFGGYNAFYVNVGIGVGLILGGAFILSRLWQKSKFLAIGLMVAVVISNLGLINQYNKDGLIVQIKAQPYMKLPDELALVDHMYKTAKGESFTVRATTMPYKIQTVWAYLFNYYAKDKWGYLPSWETEIVLGYPGDLPRPREGTTCLRFLIREPARGIPEELIIGDQAEEDKFSKVVSEKNFGHFLLQTREAKGKCHEGRL